MRVRWLGEPDAQDETLVGGKSANLSRLASAFRVPPGFCIDASVRDRLGRAAEGDAGARAMLRELVRGSYGELARRVGVAEPAVAVRSSAIGEDSKDSSFAGQHDTVLDVRGVDAVVGAVLECWRSVSSERAATYRRERGIGGEARIAVLVQAMVPADASAIAFSADPVTGAADIVVVNATRGLGAALASGEVTPDTYRVRKSDLALVERSSANGALAESDVVAIAGLAVELETAMAGPVDVECALASGSLHLLQCRPITTLGDDFTITWNDPADAELVWRRDDAHHFGVLQPLGIEYTRTGAGYGVRKRDEKLGPPVLMRFEAFNGRMYNSTKPLRPPEEMARYQQDAVARRRRLARHIRADWDQRYLPELDLIYAWMGALDLDGPSRAEAATAWDELWRRHRRAWTIHMLVTAGSYPVMDELGQLYESYGLGAASEAFALTQGLAHTLQRLDRDLATLTAAARRSPAVASAVAGGAPIDEISALDPAFARAVDDVIARHGDTGQASEGLGAPAWADDPSLLIGALALRIAKPVDDPDARLAELRANAERIERRARMQLADRPGDLARFDEVLAAARSAGPLTEEHNYWLDRRNQACMGRAVRTFGRRLVRDGALAVAEDIFLLYLPEVRDALARPRDLSALIAERRAEQRRWKRMRSPETIGAAPDPSHLGSGTTMVASRHLLHKEPQGDTTRALKGLGASTGIARGPARLIRDTAQFGKMRPGDVLVCQSSNVSWIPLFVTAAAVVTEVGGPLSHAAVVAREFGVPAVVGTGVALSVLRDDEPLEIDGTAGIVRRLSAEPARG